LSTAAALPTRQLTTPEPDPLSLQRKRKPAAHERALARSRRGGASPRKGSSPAYLSTSSAQRLRSGRSSTAYGAREEHHRAWRKSGDFLRRSAPYRSSSPAE